MEKFPITDNPESKKENSEFSEETRKELADSFMANLNSQKIEVEKNMELMRKILPESAVDAFKGLTIFSRAVSTLSRDERVPEKDRMLLKIALMDLSPVGSRDIVPGADSYTYAIKSILETLDKLLTEEVSVAIHAYAGKIFVPPAEEYYKSTS